MNFLLQIDKTCAIAKQGIQILDILTSFSRKQKVTKAELDYVQAMFPDSNSISDLIKDSTLLPFHMVLNDSWTVLSPEIDSEGIHQLLPLSIPLTLSPDKFFALTIEKRLVPSVRYNLNEKAHEKSVAGVIVGRYSEIKTYLHKFKDYEVAIQTAVLIGGKFPCGIDRINAYSNVSVNL